MRRISISALVAGVCLLMLAGGGAPLRSSSQTGLTEQEAIEWFADIVPNGSDLEYEDIPWHSTVLEGLVEAQKQDKPLLLWQMRGHPLGFT